MDKPESHRAGALLAARLLSLIDGHSERINQILDDGGDAVDLLDRLEHATLTALDDIRAAITATIHSEEHTPCAS